MEFSPPIPELNLSDLGDGNLTNSSSLDEMLTFSEESCIEAILYGVLFVFAGFGNVPVLLNLLRVRHRKSRVQRMVLHLTIADLLVTFVMIPLEISWRITIRWVAGDAACRIMLFMRAFGPYLSSMVLICISMDRFTAIVHPLRVSDAERRTNIMLMFAWGTSILCSIPQSIIFHVESHPKQSDFTQCVSFNSFSSQLQYMAYNLFCIMVLYGTPLCVIIFCYSRIMWEIRQRSRRTNNNTFERYAPADAHSKRFNMRLSDITQIERSRARTLKMTVIIVMTFFCCWTPYVVIDLWYLFDSQSAEALNSHLQSFLFLFAVSNSCVNPLVYGSYIFSYCNYIKGCCRRCRRRPSTHHDRLSQMDTRRSRNTLTDGDQYRLYPSEGIQLELKEATPIRRPLNGRGRRQMEGMGESEC